MWTMLLGSLFMISLRLKYFAIFAQWHIRWTAESSTTSKQLPPTACLRRQRSSVRACSNTACQTRWGGVCGKQPIWKFWAWRTFSSQPTNERRNTNARQRTLRQKGIVLSCSTLTYIIFYRITLGSLTYLLCNQLTALSNPSNYITVNLTCLSFYMYYTQAYHVQHSITYEYMQCIYVCV